MRESVRVREREREYESAEEVHRAGDVVARGKNVLPSERERSRNPASSGRQGLEKISLL